LPENAKAGRDQKAGRPGGCRAGYQESIPFPLAQAWIFGKIGYRQANETGSQQVFAAFNVAAR
jgi:hypothetical protein